MPKVSVREELLATALDMLHRCGFNASSVEDITKAADVPKGCFYNHFESKEALGAAALDRYWDGCVARLKILSDETIAPVERLQLYFRCLSETLAGWNYKGCLVGNFSTELSDQSRLIRDRLCSILAGWTRAVENCIREAQSAGQIGNDLEASVLAAFLVNSWEGAALRAKVDKDGKALEQFETVIFVRLLV
jgi:TetR/AcrR family transcriptional regulator, transcriptional repressor for nem operon